MSIREGAEAFDMCDVKVVKFKDFVYVDRIDGDKVLSDNFSEETRRFAGSGAVLKCPRTEDDDLSVRSEKNNHWNRQNAYKSLKKQAGQLLCHDCMYSTKTPVQVSILRAEYAKVEKERIEAFQALEAAHEEIRETT